MFDTLSDKFQNLFTTLSKNRKLTEENISNATREVRLSLLEADVNYSVASSFIKSVKEKALGDKVLKSISPSEQFIEVIHEELKDLMGKEESILNYSSNTSFFMLCGLQGSGKTSSCAKLAKYLQKQNKKVLLVAADLQRPAAILQLQKLASDISCEVFSIENEKKPLNVVKKAKEHAEQNEFDVVVIDTAGRLHLDDELMRELEQIKSLTDPSEILFVANATTGQDAVNTAFEFDKRLDITGSILTMLDGDARGGAAISISHITKKPLKFEGIGERIDDFQLFNPKSMADRILGMGDIVNLVKKAKENIDEEESKDLEKKLKKAAFTYDDYLRQMKMMKKMGSVKSLMKMVPGFSSMGDIDLPEDELKKIESIILSMTPSERFEREELSHHRKKRIAKGSGTKIDDVNKLVKGFKRIKTLLKSMNNKGFKGLFSNMNQLKKKSGRNFLWP
jgi:signal recognition particle subunit SRP54